MKKSKKGAKKNPEKDKNMESVIKDVEKALFAIKFYPVAVDVESKNEALERLEKIFSKGSETVRQLVLYMVHGQLALASEMKIMHTFE
ncbi:hypothetical protein GF318_02210, partial [Candidatus Micrarchaeota archaeon]|nr:hypothetical protein [Candidatus Micrarchaeota archaeon]